MSEQNNQGGDNTPTIESLQTQIENLNKGIATYRDEAQTANKTVAESKALIEKLEKDLEDLKKSKANDKGGDDDGEVVLNPADQKKLEAWAKKQGFVTKEEMDAQKAEIFNASLKGIESQAIDEFLKQHPQYDKDEEWAKVKEQFDLYKTPTSLSGYRQLLSKIHKELNPEDAGAKARAEIETKKRLGFGGGNQKGGDEGGETIESLQAKYPRLSRQQIESRLAEINSIYKDKKK